MKETALQTPRSAKKEVGGGATDARAEFALQPVGKGMAMQLCQCVSDIEPGKTREVEGKWFKICFYFLLPFYDIFGNKLNSLS